MTEYIKSSLKENYIFLNGYIDGISIPYDDYLEDHILRSSIFSIFMNNTQIGFFGKLDKMVTIFYIQTSYFNFAVEIFEDIKEKYEIQEAFIPTTDLGFLSVAIEKYKKIDIQAFHFSETNRIIRPAEFIRDKLRLATQSDLNIINIMAKDFLDDYEKLIDQKKIYVLEDNNEIIGLGVIVDNVIMRNCKGTGMFTREDKRRKGVGRSIIIHLKSICHDMGVTIAPGCWYFNKNSKKTLESAGYISKSKLLRFTF